MAFAKVVDIGHEDGTTFGKDTAAKVSFYGVNPVAQRAYSSTYHATAAVVTSTSFGTLQVAQVQEIQKTLQGLGIWATA